MARMVSRRRRAHVGPARSARRASTSARSTMPTTPGSGRHRRCTAPTSSPPGRPTSADRPALARRRCTASAEAVMRGIALGLGLPADWFAANLTADPTVLFRIFHYPPDDRRRRRLGRRPSTPTTACSPCSGPGHARRAPGARAATGWIDVAADPGHVRVQPRRHARAPDRRPLPVDPAPRPQRHASRAGSRSRTSSIRPGTPPCRCSRSRRATHRDGRSTCAMGRRRRRGLDRHLRRLPHGQGRPGVPRPVRRHRNLTDTSLAIRRPARVEDDRGRRRPGAGRPSRRAGRAWRRRTSRGRRRRRVRSISCSPSTRRPSSSRTSAADSAGLPASIRSM